MGKINDTILHKAFCLWYMRRGKGSNLSTINRHFRNTVVTPDDIDNKDNDTIYTYENSIKYVAMIRSVEEFWEVYDYLIRPGNLPNTTDYHFFREGIKPTWEDRNNSSGGKWILRLRKGLASRYWEEVIFALIGCQFTGIPDGEVCGAVVSIRYAEDIISIWNRTANDTDITERICDTIKRVLQLPHHVNMEYKPHGVSLQDKSSLRNAHLCKPKNYLEKDLKSTLVTSFLRSSDSRGDRDEMRVTKVKKESQRSWR